MTGATLIPWSVAIIQPIFRAIGPAASSGWRFAFGAVVLLAISRPNLRKWTKEQWITALIFGFVTAFMNQAFYQAIERIPLGSAVCIEFITGPFLVAALGKRSWNQFLLILLGGVGVVCLSHPGGGVTFAGAVFAVGAGLGWASYILASHRMGGQTLGFEGLAVSMSISTIFCLPFIVGSAHTLLSQPYLSARMLIVATMSIVFGFGAELLAFRRVKPATAGVMMSLDPALAFMIGVILLSEKITALDILGLVLIVSAGVGVTFREARKELLAAE
jgi:inner membrane transporter RhtA